MTDSNPLPPPTDEQKDIIKTGENTIVVSNPGTGKTFTLALKVMELLGNQVEPEDICRAVRFILDSPAVTGQMIAIDAGQHMGML